MVNILVWYDNLVDCGKSDVYNSQVIIKIKEKNDTQSWMAKPEEKPYFHQISMNWLEKLVDCIAKFNKGEIDADTSCQIEKQILTDEIDGPEYYPLPYKKHLS